MAARVKSGATTASTVATVTLTADYPSVKVINRGGGDLTVGLDGAVPTVLGDDFDVVAANTSGLFSSEVSTNTIVKVISANIVDYTVVGVS